MRRVYLSVAIFIIFCVSACQKVNVWNLMPSNTLGVYTETIWQADRTPAGDYQKIGIRRLSDGTEDPARAVVVYFPPSYTGADFYTNNAGEYLEKYDFRIYLVNRDYDVYSIDYRTSFVPDGQTDLSYMTGWNEATYLEDLHDAVDFIKDYTGTDKVYIAGHSSGAKYVYLYAAKYWQDDLKGLIVMDGSPWEMDGSPAAAGSMDFNSLYSVINNGNSESNRQTLQGLGLNPDPDTYYNNLLPPFGGGFNQAVADYYDPDKGPNYGPYEGFTTVSDYLEDQYQNVWGDKQFANPEGGYSTVEMLTNFLSQVSVPYWPVIEYGDDAYTGNWSGAPPAPTGFIDPPGWKLAEELAKVNIPIIVFASSEWTTALGMNFDWKAEGPQMLATTDQTYYLLEGFGHLDVLIGEQAQTLVFEPLYNWLVAHDG